MAEGSKGGEITVGRALLGCLMADFATSWPTAAAAGLRANWFASKEERAVFAAMGRLAARGGEVDAVLIYDTARAEEDAPRDFAWYERTMDAAVSVAHLSSYVSRLRDQAVARDMCALMSESREDLGRDPSDEVAARLSASLLECAAQGTGREIDKRAAMDSKIALWQEVARQRYELGNASFCIGTPLPWACLNSVFCGLRPGLHVLGARTSVGKTVFAVNCSQYWMEQGIPHAFVSLDMGEGELLARFVAGVSRVSLRKLEWGASKAELEKAREAAAAVEAAPLFVSGEANVGRLGAWLRMMKVKKDIRAVVIDYVQLCHAAQESPAHPMRMFERVCESVQYLKRLANDLGLPMLLLAQLSREVDRAARESVYSEPTLADLGDSSEIEKAASSVTLMYRDRIVEQIWERSPPVGLAYGQQSLAKSLRAVWLKVEKNQQGLAGVRRPFVMYPAYFILRPGSYQNREPIQSEIFDAAKNKNVKVANWLPSFRQIRDDWRTLPEDETLKQFGALGDREYKENE